MIYRLPYDFSHKEQNGSRNSVTWFISRKRDSRRTAKTIPELPVFAPVQSQNRFNLVVQLFIKTLADKEHPLVLFLDDLHWADSASLYLLKLFTTDSEIENLFVIGAYRPNETLDAHPLILTLDEIEKAGDRVKSIFLAPLTSDQVGQLLADTLNHPEPETKSLADVVHNKTGGNPFFVNEF